MQNVKKVELKNNSNHKRNRRRKKNMAGYYLLVAILTVGIAFSLSVTLLFNVREVVVSGVAGSVYTENDIADASGIMKGDNLVRMNTEKIEAVLMDGLLYADNVKVKKSFPDKVNIELTPSIEMAYVECKGGYMLVSEGWRIIGHSENPDKENLLIVKGFSPESNEEKTVMKSTDSDKNNALAEIISQIKLQDLKKIVSVDITDKYDVILNYDNRIKIKIEKPQDVEYKLKYAKKIITEELRENKNGYLIYRNSLGYSYVSEEEYERINGSVSNMITVNKPDSFTSGETDLPVSETAGITETSESVTDTSLQQIPEGW